MSENMVTMLIFCSLPSSPIEANFYESELAEAGIRIGQRDIRIGSSLKLMEAGAKTEGMEVVDFALAVREGEIRCPTPSP